MTLSEQIEALLEQFIPVIRDAFRAAIADVVDNVILADVIKAIQEGDAIRAYQALGFSPSAMRPITAAIEQAFEQGGITTGGTFPKRLNTATGRAVFRFDVRDSRAERWIRDESSTLITHIEDDTRTIVRDVMFQGVRDGRNPRTVAVDLVGNYDPVAKKRVGGTVGLTPQFERAVARSRVELKALDASYFNRERRDKRFDNTVRKAIRDGKPLPADVIEKLTTRYADGLLKLRGETIARTEALAALNRSEYEALLQARDMGAVNISATVRIWDNAGDVRVRHSHNMMEGQRVGIDEPFVFPDGSRAYFPGDSSLDAPGQFLINCRCRVRLKVDWLKDLK